jgi:hypothetical protein
MTSYWVSAADVKKTYALRVIYDTSENRQGRGIWGRNRFDVGGQTPKDCQILSGVGTMPRLMGFVAIFLVTLCFSKAVQAGETVDVALVLVSDVSRSIDDREFKMQKDGYLSAFTDPKVMAAVKSGIVGEIAVNYVEFAGESEVQTVIDWTIIKDEETAKAFVEKLVAAPRSFYGRTAIGAGIDLAVQNLAHSALTAERRVIDVCGDGTNNAGRDVSSARDEAVAAGITINGLTIINDHPMSWTFAHVQPPGGLDNYYRQNVTGGVGSFVISVHDFKIFGEAMAKKLISEIASLDNHRKHL